MQLVEGIRKSASALTPPIPAPVTVSDALRIADYPELQSLHDIRKKKKEDKGWFSTYKPLLVAGALGGIGYGLYRGGKGILSPDDRRKLTNVDAFLLNAKSDGLDALGRIKEMLGFSSDVKPVAAASHIRGSDYAFYDYLDKMTQAASVRPFGKSVAELMGMLRERVGGKYGMKKKDWRSELGAEHYDFFQRGPLAAMEHQLHKHKPFYEDFGYTQHVPGGLETRAMLANGIEKNLLSAKGSPDGQKAYESMIAEAMGEAGKVKDFLPDRDAPTFPSKLEEADTRNVAGLLAQMKMRSTGDTNSAFGLTSRWQDLFGKYMQQSKGVGYEGVPALSSSLSHGEEMELMRGFPGWLKREDPVFAEKFEPYLRSQAADQLGVAGNYKILSTAARGIQDTAVGGGIAAMVGGGAIGGLGLWKRYKENLLSKERKKNNKLYEAGLRAQLEKRLESFNRREQ